MLFDTANDAAGLWDSTDADPGPWSISGDARHAGDDLPARRGGCHGARTIQGVSPVWLKPGLPISHGYVGQVAGGPDGTRLFLLGFASEADNGAVQQRSLGVFVVDTATESLVQRWHPDATYIAIQAVLDGSVVVVGGAPGADAAGMQAPWDASMTFHDAADGRILLRLGQVGQGYGSSVLEP